MLSSIALYKEGDDLEGYLRVVEDSYIKAGLAKCEWMFNLRAKLVGKALEFFSEISGTTKDYLHVWGTQPRKLVLNIMMCVRRH